MLTALIGSMHISLMNTFLSLFVNYMISNMVQYFYELDEVYYMITKKTYFDPVRIYFQSLL